MPLLVKHWLTGSQGFKVGALQTHRQHESEEKELHELTVDEHKELEAKTMERNAWSCWRLHESVINKHEGTPVFLQHQTIAGI